MNKKSAIFRSAIAFIFCVVTIVMYWIVSFTASFNDHTKIITVTDKERVNTSSYSKYLIMGEDENGETLVLENTDNTIRFKFNSSDIYAALKEGETYEVEVIGYRVPFLSMYENIISYKEVE